MEFENHFFRKSTFGVYLSPERKEIVSQNYVTVFGTDADLKPAEAFWILFETALSQNVAKCNSKELEELSRKCPALEKNLQDALDEIERLNARISDFKSLEETNLLYIRDLKTEVETLKASASDTSQINDLNLEITERDQIIHNLSLQIESMRSSTGVPEGAVMVVLTQGESKVIAHICAEETKRTGKQVTPESLFKNVFFFVLINGPHDMFSAPVGIRKINELIKNTTEFTKPE